MEGSAAVTVATVLGNITSVFTSVVGMIGDGIEMITGNPLLLTAVLLPLAVAFVPKGLRLIKTAFGRRKI